MAARAAIRTLLGTDPELNDLGITVDQIYASGAVDTPPIDELFLVVRLEDVVQAFPGQGTYYFTIWVHISKTVTRDYGLLDSVTDRVRELMEQAENVAGSDGWTLTAAKWDASSADNFDEGFNTLARSSRFRTACRSVVSA